MREGELMGISLLKLQHPFSQIVVIILVLYVVISFIVLNPSLGLGEIMEQAVIEYVFACTVLVIYFLLFIYCLKRILNSQTFRSLLYLFLFLLLILAYSSHILAVFLGDPLYLSGTVISILLLEWMILVTVVATLKPDKKYGGPISIVFFIFISFMLFQSYMDYERLALALCSFMFFIYLPLLYFMVRWYKQKNIKLMNPLIMSLTFMMLSFLFVVLSLFFEELAISFAGALKVIAVLFLGYVVLSFFKRLEEETDTRSIDNELELLFEHSGDAIVVYRKDLSIVRSNYGFKQMFGYTDEDDLTVASLIPADLMIEYRGLLQQLDKGVPVINFQTKRKRKDLAIIDISISTSMIKRGGETLYAAILRDITEQKQAEAEVIKARKELQEAVELHNGIIFRVRREHGRFIHPLIDGKLLRMQNISTQSLIGKELIDFLPIKYTTELESYYEKAWGGKEQVFQMKFMDYTFLLSLFPKYESGQVIEIVGTCSDITTAIKTEELLRKSEKLSVVGELAAGFAHEIRNPLTTIKGFLQLIQQSSKSVNQEYMSIISNEIDRLEMITNEFMAVSKPEAIQYQKENVHELILKVNRFLKPQAILNNVELCVEQEVETPYIYADKNQMRQVFINLYKNAIEAMTDGGKIITNIRISNDGMVSIIIKDQGCGIPAHLIDKLGEPFYTLKEKGTGLGLMVTKKIIDSHYGFMDIYSMEQVGTTVTVTLPLYKEQLD